MEPRPRLVQTHQRLLGLLEEVDERRVGAHQLVTLSDGGGGGGLVGKPALSRPCPCLSISAPLSLICVRLSPSEHGGGRPWRKVAWVSLVSVGSQRGGGLCGLMQTEVKHCRKEGVC